ncbi:MAG TPA: D-alanine--D-alanine ligase, partial [Thermoanaerobaculia bacterium]
EEYPGAMAEQEAQERKPKTRRRKRHKRPKLDREEIFDALTKLGHEPFYQIVDGSEQSLTLVARSRCDLVFNLTESFAGDYTKDMNLAAFLDLIDKRYTGSGPRGLYLAQDKALAKKIFAFYEISTPQFAISYKGKLDHSHDLQFPLIVKPSNEDGSIGIDVGAVVTSVKELMERIHYIQEEFDAPALVEQYIEGREIYAAVLGNDRPEALPLVELDLSKLPEGVPRIAGYEVKFDRDTDAYKKTRSAVVENLDDDTVKRLQETAVAAYQALKLRDYGRIDMRLTDEGKIFVIEANPNPWLSSSAEFSIAARKSGRSYNETIGEIVKIAGERYE